MNLKRQIFVISCTNLPKKERGSLYRNVTGKWPTRNKYPYMEVSRDNGAYKSSKLQLSNHCSTFILKNQLASFSYQHSISFTHGLKHSCFLGQANLHRLCGLWQEFRQIWTIFLVQKWLQLIGSQSKSVQEKRQKCRISTETKPFNGRSRFQPVYSQGDQLVVAADNFVREQNLLPVL